MSPPTIGDSNQINQIKSNFIHQVTLNKHKMHQEFDLMLALNQTNMRTHTNLQSQHTHTHTHTHTHIQREQRYHPRKTR
jgi:hypothetical protein